MHRSFFIIVVWLVTGMWSTASAQWIGHILSVRSMALGLSNITNSSAALDINPTQVADSGVRISASFIPLPIGLEKSWSAAASGEYPMDKTQLLGGSVLHSGYADLYSFTDIAGLYSKTVEVSESRKASVGLRIRFSEERFGDHYLPLQDLSVDVGATFDIGKTITAGAAVTHLASLYRNQDLPSEERTGWLGFAYRPIREVAIHAALELPRSKSAMVHAGIEYFLEQYLALRIGVIPDLSEYSGGIGVHTGAVALDFAVVHHPDLGSTLAFGLSYSL